MVDGLTITILMTLHATKSISRRVIERCTELAMLALKEEFYIPLLAALRIKFLQSETIFFAESNKNL